MAIVAVILSGLAAAAPAADASRPIYVNGHAWAPFISPMGEPFRAHDQTDDTLADWFRKADRNGDGVLTEDEMVADAERFFRQLDTDGNGEIDPDELSDYEYEIAPDVQVNSRRRPAPGDPAPKAEESHEDVAPSHGRSGGVRRLDLDQLAIGGGLQGAARYGLLDMPEPVAAADTDFNRGISLEEFREAAVRRFALLDSRHVGQLTLPQLEAIRTAALANARKSKRNDKARDARIGNGLPPGS
jgi:EF hand